MNQDEKKVVRIIALVIAVALVVAFVTGSIRIVSPGERGVKITLGKLSDTVYNEGIALKWPVLSKIQKLNVQNNTYASVTECFSSDLQTMKINYSLIGRLPTQNLVTLYRNYRGNVFRSFVQARLEERLKQVTAKYRAEDATKQRETLRVQVLELLKPAVSEVMEIQDFIIQNIDLTDNLEKAIEDKQVMEQLAKQKEYELVRERTQAEIVLVKANAEAQAITTVGKALKENTQIVDLKIAEKWNGISPLYVSTTPGNSAGVLLPAR